MTITTPAPAILRNPVAKLPLFDSSEIAWNKAEYQKTHDHDHFVRPARVLIEVGAAFALSDILERTDRELAKISAYTGALIVPHAWGIIEKPADESVLDIDAFITAEHIDLPDDMLLAARVETIRDITPLNATEYHLLEAGMRRYRDQSLTGYDATQRLTDVANPGKARQYSKGQTISMSEPGLILHDIEPLIRLR